MQISTPPSVSSINELEAWREILKAPDKTIADIKAATADHDKTRAAATAAEEKAKQEQAVADAKKADAEAIMAGVRKAEADLAKANNDFAERKSDTAKAQTATNNILDIQTRDNAEREAATERREIACRAREERLANMETEVAALKKDYEAKLAAFKATFTALAA